METRTITIARLASESIEMCVGMYRSARSNRYRKGLWDIGSMKGPGIGAMITICGDYWIVEENDTASSIMN